MPDCSPDSVPLQLQKFQEHGRFLGQQVAREIGHLCSTLSHPVLPKATAVKYCIVYNVDKVAVVVEFLDEA